VEEEKGGRKEEEKEKRSILIKSIIPTESRYPSPIRTPAQWERKKREEKASKKKGEGGRTGFSSFLHLSLLHLERGKKGEGEGEDLLEGKERGDNSRYTPATPFTSSPRAEKGKKKKKNGKKKKKKKKKNGPLSVGFLPYHLPPGWPEGGKGKKKEKPLTKERKKERTVYVSLLFRLYPLEGREKKKRKVSGGKKG